MSDFLTLVISAFKKDSDAVVAVSQLAAKAIRKAYTSKEGSTVMVQVMLDHMTRNYRDALPTFFRKAGINVTIEPGKPAIVGGVLDKTKQAKVFAWLDTSPLVMDTEDVIRKKKAVKAPEGTIAEQGTRAIEAFIKRLSNDKNNPLAADVAAFVQRKLDKPAKVETVREAMTLVDEEGGVYELDEYELKFMIGWLVERQLQQETLSAKAA